MTAGAWVGLVLVGAGVIDLLVAFVLVGPRLPEQTRRPVQLALVIAAVLVIALGVLYLRGTLGGERSA